MLEAALDQQRRSLSGLFSTDTIESDVRQLDPPNGDNHERSIGEMTLEAMNYLRLATRPSIVPLALNPKQRVTVTEIFANGRIRVEFPDGTWKAFPGFTSSESSLSATGWSGSNSSRSQGIYCNLAVA